MNIKNNKGFTLVETLAVIVLLGVALMIAVPSINNLAEKSKEKEMLEDAKMFATLVENKVVSDVSTDVVISLDPNIKTTFTLDDIDSSLIGQSPYGNNYHPDSSVEVFMCNDSYVCSYWIELIAFDGSDRVTVSGYSSNSLSVDRG